MDEQSRDHDPSESLRERRRKAGGKGGQATAKTHAFAYCPTCGQLLPVSPYYSEMGKKGAVSANKVNRFTHEQRVAWGKLGGRGKKKDEEGQDAAKER